MFALLLIGLGYYKPETLVATRSFLADNVARPFYWLINFPSGAWNWVDTKLTSREALEERNLALEHENLILQRNVLHMASLMAENARLKELLNSTELLDDSALVANLLGVSQDPLRHEITIKRGRADGVFEGQPVLDASGLVGIVIDIAEHTARVLLITDTSNAVPIKVNRNGVRGIAEGSGHLDELYIRNLVPTTDIKEGDLIVSSGLGGRYPPGYPVGEVVRIEYEGADSFLRVVVRPSAQLDRSQQLLLVFRSQAKNPETESAPITNNTDGTPDAIKP